MSEVTMYSTERCPFCQQAEQLLKRKGVNDLKKSQLISNRTRWKP